jgi:hypothetical protein
LSDASQHRQRGQALIETAIALPAFLLVLYGLIWASQFAVQYERVESAIRYTSQISWRQNPYVDDSFASLYAQLAGSGNLPATNCTVVDTDVLSDAAPTFSSTIVGNTTVSPSFWTPLQPSTGCVTSQYFGMQQNAIHGQENNQDMLFTIQVPTVSATVPVPPPVAGAFGSAATANDSEYLYKPLGNAALVACYPGFQSVLKASLDYKSDTSTPTMPIAVTSTELLNIDEHMVDYFAIQPQCLTGG